MSPTIDVDLDAIVYNYFAYAGAVGVPIMPIIKADGYGHGAVPVSRAVVDAGASWLGAVDINEAVALRAAGVTSPRIVTWMHSPATDWQAAFEAEIDLAVSSIEQLSLIELAAKHRRGKRAQPVNVHLKLDTGLGRNGAGQRDWRALMAHAADAQRNSNVRVMGLMSHLSGTSKNDDLEQGRRFDIARELAREAGLEIEFAHIASTASALEFPQLRHDLVRLGIAMYGLSPDSGDAAETLGLKPALRLFAPIRRFNNRWAVAVGEGDGLPPLKRDITPLVDSAGTLWRVDEVRPLHLYISPVGDAQVDADDPRYDATTEHEPPRELIVIGQGRDTDGKRAGADPDAWGRAANTINYEITTRLTRRILRDYGEAEAAHETHIPWPPLEDQPGASRRSVTAPRREAVIDLGLLQRRLERLTQRSLAVGAQRRSVEFGVDVSSDAYGHGLDQILPYLRDSGLPIVARTRADLESLTRRGVQGMYVPDAPSTTRGIYGLDPREPLPVTLSLVSELIHVKRVSKGQRVGYGYEWTAPENTTLGLIPVGYADALPRAAIGKAQVMVGGWAAPIVGRIAMDQIVVDLGDRECWPGMSVRIWGNQGGDITISQWATWTGHSPEALCANLGSRIERRYEGRRIAATFA